MKILIVFIVIGLLAGCSGVIGPDGVHHKDGYITWDGDIVDKNGDPLYPEELDTGGEDIFVIR